MWAGRLFVLRRARPVCFGLLGVWGVWMAAARPPAYVYLSGSDFGLPALTWSGFHQLCLAPPPHRRLLIEREPAWPRTRICLTSYEDLPDLIESNHQAPLSSEDPGH
ncbi:hypothetical protein PCASD_02137 [Puccinia coronata f. sp. avenae]|uniref:Uncharacterized protein n=1 Tax=Puccinia coronata f. sp. avenae TaxID=200324 RepID=A0A2N5VPV6_9BASI|nr:hypothetical protein PCASD_18932 [Puccinia coronata f. sp. avenae]PLW52038.1 hypothetical protein PCASD_02137 [Puccinia coronata f. sp. avenae]